MVRSIRSLLALSMFIAAGATAQTIPQPLSQPNLDFAQPGQVNAIVPLADGSLIVGGVFSTLGGVARSNLARVRADGTVDPAFDTVVAGEVRAITVNPFDGAIYIGGQFTAVDGTSRLRVARLDATGTLDANWNPGTNGTVNALVFDAGAAGVIIGGAFSQAGGSSRSCLARVSAAGTGTLDATWAPGSAGCTVNRLLLDAASSSIYAAGTFSSLGGLSRNALARLSTVGAGAGIAAFDAAVPAGSNFVFAIDRAPGGRLFVGGQFGGIGGATRSNLARLDPDTGTADAGWVRNINGFVSSLSVSASDVIVGGDFVIAGASPRTRLVRYATADGAALDANWAPQADARVESLARRIDGAVAIGGFFTRIDTGFDAAFSVVDGTNAGALVETAAEQPGRIAAIALTADGGMIVGGRFHRIGTVRRDNLARVDGASGQVTVDFAPVIEGTVAAVATDAASGAVFVGGSFFRVNNLVRTNLVRLTAQGATDPAFTATANSQVSALHFDAVGGRLYAGGVFTTVAGVAQALLARLDPASGELDQTWRPTVVGASITNMLAVPADTALVIAGNFTMLNGLERNGLARVSLTTGAGVDAQWNPAPNNSVSGLALAGDSIVVGGNFSAFGSTLRNRIARLSRTGTGTPTAWNPGASSTVTDVAYDPDRDAVFAAGVFTQVAGQVRNGLARIEGSGALDPNWRPSAAIGAGISYARLLHVPARDALLVGGQFSTIGGQARRTLAALPDDADPIFRDGFD